MSQGRPLTIAFFWTGVSPTMTACWRALAALPNTRVVVFLELPAKADTAFEHEALLEGIECRVYAPVGPLLRTGQARHGVTGLRRGMAFRDVTPFEPAAVEREIAAVAPDAMIVLGWRSPLCRLAAESPVFRAVPKLFAFDMPFVWSLRKLVAPLVLRRYLSRFVTAVVPGERSAAYARYLGFPETKIERGLIGLDTAAAAEAARARAALPAYPRRFLFVGRYAPEKRIDLLVAAYRRYRTRVSDPWGLTCCGMGPEAGRLRGVEGIEDRGFVQPAAMGEVFATHGAFVLASDYDPWPFVIAEAVAAGLPVVCTSACGNSVELVRSYFNGRVVGAGDVAGFAEALEWVHAHEAEVRWIGERGMPLAAPYAKEVWAERVRGICTRAVAADA
jgi:glycosyltransferase involved in cell wall biosynthesis